MQDQKFSTAVLRDTTNIIEKEELNSSFDKVFTDVINILSDYNGPHGQLAALFARNELGMIDTKFTKDGINIIKAIEYANPVDEHVLSLIKYIGTSMERAAGDGTTSSMIIAATLLKNLRASGIANVTAYPKFMNTFNKFSKDLVDKLGTYKIKAEDGDTDLIRGIAYHQARTSSHGDDELAKIVSDLLASLPMKAWEHMIYRAESVETNVRYRIEFNDASFSTHDVGLMDQRMFNDELGTALEHDDATIIVTPSDVTRDNQDLLFAVDLINKQTPEDKAIVLITLQPDNTVARILNDLYTEKRLAGCKFAILFLYPPKVQIASDTNALFAACGVDNIKHVNPCLVKHNVKLKYTLGDLRIYGLVKYNERGYHPDATDPDSPAGRFIYIAEENIAHFLKLANNSTSRTNIRALKSARNKLMFERIGNVVVGGCSYDMQSSMDIIQDVLVAARESLTSGATNGGYKTLLKSAKELYIGSNLDFTYCTIAKAFVESIKEFSHLLLKTNFAEEFIDDADMCTNLITGTHCPFTVDTLKNVDAPIVIQSLASCEEFLKRFGDIVPKILYTNRIFIPNAINDQHKEK
jgi:hypothetical protein